MIARYTPRSSESGSESGVTVYDTWVKLG